MLSPFCCQANTPAQAEEEWTRFLDAARLREGDILALQDAVGAGHISLDQMDGYFRAFHNAAAQKEGLRFWANNENFTASTWDCAPLSRFVIQMNTAAPYVEKHVTFAYSHYYNCLLYTSCTTAEQTRRHTLLSGRRFGKTRSSSESPFPLLLLC